MVVLQQGAQAQVPAVPQQWRLETSVSSVYDSNINHDPANLHSYGTIVGLAGTYRNRAAKPTVELAYEAALHQYTGTSRWNRVSQQATATVARDLGRLRLLTIADAALRGSSDDRKLDDRYTLMERAQIRLDATRRLQLSGAFRLRRSREEPGRNANHPYAGIALEQRLGPAALTGSYRWEANNARDPKKSDRRAIWALDLDTPLGAGDRLELEAKTRAQRYPNKLVTVAGASFPRYDLRWNPSLAWTHRFHGGASARVSYEYEHRSSNLAGEEFRAHLFGVTIVRAW